MRRTGPRPIAAALGRLSERLAPETTLAAVQAVWADVAGAAVAAEAQPVSEHAGVLTVTCRSAVWAQELGLLAPDLLASLNAALATAEAPGPLRELRVMAGGARTRPATSPARRRRPRRRPSA